MTPRRQGVSKKTIVLAADVRLLKIIEVPDEVAASCEEYSDAPDEVAKLVASDSIEDGKDGWSHDELRGLEIVGVEK